MSEYIILVASINWCYENAPCEMVSEARVLQANLDLLLQSGDFIGGLADYIRGTSASFSPEAICLCVSVCAVLCVLYHVFLCFCVKETKTKKERSYRAIEMTLQGWAGKLSAQGRIHNVLDWQIRRRRRRREAVQTGLKNWAVQAGDHKTSFLPDKGQIDISKTHLGQYGTGSQFRNDLLGQRGTGRHFRKSFLGQLGTGRGGGNGRQGRKKTSKTSITQCWVKKQSCCRVTKQAMCSLYTPQN